MQSQTRQTAFAALDEFRRVFDSLDEISVQTAVSLLAGARRLAFYGVGREGLQIKGLAMRLYHLGLAIHVVGDMSCAMIEKGDLLVVSAGPGEFSTVLALMHTAQQAGAQVLVFTAQSSGACARAADATVLIPAQTMADDSQSTGSVLPMGSLYEGVLYVLFEVLVLQLRERLGVSAQAMRERHTNLE